MIKTILLCSQFQAIQCHYGSINQLNSMQNNKMQQQIPVKIEEYSQGQARMTQQKLGKEFRFDNINIKYQNTYEISEFEQEQGLGDGKLNIMNYLCYNQDNKIKKITDISFENKKIRIQDQFQFDGFPNIDAEGVTQKIKSVQLIKRKNNVHPEKKPLKRDTKNIVKNIVKLFLNWLSLQASTQYMQAHKRVQQVIQQVNFNNYMIQMLAQDNTINSAFLTFVDIAAVKYIEHSKINDKNSHINALQVYRQVFMKKTKKSNINEQKITQDS